MVSVTGSLEAITAIIPVAATVAIAGHALNLFAQPGKKMRGKAGRGFSWL